MANHKSAKKRARQTVVRTERNKVYKTKAKNAIKTLRSAIRKKDKAKASSLLPSVQGILSQLARRRIIKKNTASNKTSRLATQIAKI